MPYIELKKFLSVYICKGREPGFDSRMKLVMLCSVIVWPRGGVDFYMYCMASDMLSSYLYITGHFNHLTELITFKFYIMPMLLLNLLHNNNNYYLTSACLLATTFSMLTTNLKSKRDTQAITTRKARVTSSRELCL